MPWLRAGWVAIAIASCAYWIATRPLSVSVSSLLLSACTALIVWAWLDHLFSRDHIMGYKNRFIRISFPELGDDIWVDILNPMMAPASALTSDIPIETDDDGKIAKGSEAQMADVTYDITSKLIIRWNVYDVMDPSDDPQPLELPATPDKMKRLPMAIITKIMQEVGKATGRMNADTSTTS